MTDTLHGGWIVLDTMDRPVYGWDSTLNVKPSRQDAEISMHLAAAREPGRSPFHVAAIEWRIVEPDRRTP